MKHPKQSYALITGAGRGLGLAFALECAHRGKSLILLDLDSERLEALRAYVQEQYPIEVITQVVDLTDMEQLEQIVYPLIHNYVVEWLINNAGMGGTARFEDTSPSQLDRLVQLNVRACVLLARAVLPAMLVRQRGLILNIASIAAFAPVPYKMIYPASKAFLLSFTQGLQEEYRDTAICISSVHPGPIWTSFDAARRAMTQGWVGVQTTQTARQIASKSLDAGLRGRRMIIPGWLNKVQYILARLLPTPVYLRLSGGMIKKELADRRRQGLEQNM
ncbi:MAG: SDR family NAD(P)-dependent oxidoreductase [Bacteroidetes bacterium]|nr:MAG: SDR family NAD(P)-dependent oxidoreductase [Bacteroidota bacterium]